MTLLTPIPAAVAAAIAIPAVIVLYLLKLRRRPLRVSSTMLWEQATRDLQVNVPFRLLRPSILLFLHLLILALFLLALGRPAVGLQGEPPRRLVVLLDRSASMAAASGESTRLAHAVDRASVFVENSLRGGDAEAAVIAFAAEPRVVAGFTRNPGVLKGALRGVEVADQPGDLQAALRLAGAMVAGEGSEESARPPPALAALFSDAGFEDRSLSVAGATFYYERAGPPEGETTDNVGIVAVAARRDYEDPGLVRVLARLVNAGGAGVAVPVSLSVEGTEVERRVIEMPAATPGTPGEATAILAPRGAGRVLVTLRVERPDALASDNAASVVVQPAAAPRILLVVPDPPNGGPSVGEGPEWLLADVLRELRPRSLRAVPQSTWESAGPGGVDLVIFDRVTPRSAPDVPTISFGAGVPGAAAVAPADDPRGTYVVTWERSHPVLRQVALDTVFVSRPMHVTPAIGVRVTELARGVDGPLLVLLGQGHTRRLVVPFELADSNWPLTVGFPGFLSQAVDLLTHRAEAAGGGAVTTTEPASAAVPVGTRRVHVTGPREFDADAAERSVTLGVLERAGVYRVQPDAADSVPVPVAVNLVSPRESSLLTRDALRVSGQSVQSSGAGDAPREVWHWLVIAALVLLTLEWFLYAWQMRA